MSICLLSHHNSSYLDTILLSINFKTTDRQTTFFNSLFSVSIIKHYRKKELTQVFKSENS